MTRINLVPPAELTDQHLFAEFREIKMIPKSLARSLLAAQKRCVCMPGWSDPNTDYGVLLVIRNIPSFFTLNKGHVSFFYNKGAYLRDRYWALRFELLNRGVNFNQADKFDPDGVMLHPAFNGDYVPTHAALAIIRARIAEKIAMKPTWYRYNGIPLTETQTLKEPT